MDSCSEVKNPILHVVVVGFHHKKGCQVEYSYPPLLPGRPVDSSDCPDVWKQLPSLALPDGAHNFTEDTVYFHLPSRDLPRTTVYGVSCYRQMMATDVLNPSAELTRNSVQKSVCVLSKLPLYGLIQAKLELITHAYFRGRDFSQVTLLEDTYKTLNLSINESLLENSQVFVGLPCQDILQKFQHKLLILFKLMLLERRVLFYSSPVKTLCSSILTLISLFPGLVEHGLNGSACYIPSRLMSPAVKITENAGIDGDFVDVSCSDEAHDITLDEHVNKRNGKLTWSLIEDSAGNTDLTSSAQLTFIECQSGTATTCSESDANIVDCDTDELSVNNVTNAETEALGVHLATPSKLHSEPHSLGTHNVTSKSAGSVNSHCKKAHDYVLSESNCSMLNDNQILHSSGDTQLLNSTSTSGTGESRPDVKGVVVASDLANMEHLLEADDDISNWEADQLMLEIDDALNDNTIRDSVAPIDAVIPVHSVSKVYVSRSTSSVNSNEENNSNKKLKIDVSPLPISSLETDDMGFPLSLFTKGMMLHPYLSLHLFDLLSDVNVRGLVFGATNALFRQKSQLVDVVVEITDAKIEFHDADLKRQLTLTTADLRFADHLVKSISEDKGDIFLNSTEWEGSEDWLRAQFKAYLISLLHTVSSGDERQTEDFNTSFVSAWKTTHNYRVWKSSHNDSFQNIPIGHPFHGQLAMSDVKLRIAQAVQSTDHNKKINAVVSQTGRVVTQTSKAVGGALTSAKSAVTTWFGSFTGPKN